MMGMVCNEISCNCLRRSRTEEKGYSYIVRCYHHNMSLERNCHSENESNHGEECNCCFETATVTLNADHSD